MAEEISAQEKAVRSKSSYAWVSASSGFFSQLICVWGLGIFGICLTSIAADLGVEVTDLALASSIYGACYAGLSFVWGNLADRIGLRSTLALAAVGMGVFLIITGQLANSALTAIIFYALAGVFASGTASAVLPKLITTWFAPNMRGKGMTVVTLGGSIAGILGGIVFPQLIMNFGWRGCFTVIGVIGVVIGVLIFLLLRDDPAKIGTYPFGSPVGTEVGSYEKKVEIEDEKANKRDKMIRVLKMPITWKYGTIFVFWQFCLMTYQAYTVAAAQSAGMDLAAASLVTTFVTGGMFVGTIVFPALSDKLGRKITIVVASILTAIFAFAAYMAFGLFAAVPAIIYSVFICYGFSNSITPLHNTAMAECYPADLRGTGPGVVSTIAVIGRFGGPLLAAQVIAMSGTATSVMLFMGVCVLISGILSLIWLPKTGGKYGDPEA